MMNFMPLQAAIQPAILWQGKLTLCKGADDGHSNLRSEMVNVSKICT